MRKNTAVEAATVPAQLGALPSWYGDLLGKVKEAVTGARLRAQRAVNTELVQMYWQIGRLILARQEQEGWGTKVAARLVADLEAAFPSRYFVFELKTKDVRPEHVGKLNFYVSVVDQMVRDKERDDATIGFLIGTRHNRAAAQLALDASNNPLAVTNYSTLSPADRELVPSEEDLSRVVQEAIDAVGPADDPAGPEGPR